MESYLSDALPFVATKLNTRDSDVFIKPEIRKAIYTTNTIESLNMTLEKIIKNRIMFPSDEAVFRFFISLEKYQQRELNCL